MSFTTQSATGYPLAHLLPGAQIVGSDQVHCQAVTSRSDQCQPGDVFFAITGDDYDGHEHIDEAIRRGASAIVAERYVSAKVPLWIVEDTRPAFSVVCHRLMDNPSRKLNVIGVTGTSGKTATCQLVSSVFRAAGRKHGMITNDAMYNQGQVKSLAGVQLTAAGIASFLGHMVDAGCGYAVLETSSQLIAKYELAGCELDSAILTNLKRDHLDLHQSVENYRRIKKRIFSQVSPKGMCILNADDSSTASILDEVQTPALTVGLHHEAEITATVLERHKSEQLFVVHAGRDSVPIRTSIIGDAHIYRCLQAFAIGLAHQVPVSDIVRGIESIHSLPGNLQRIERGQPFGVYVHHAPNPSSLATALHALKQVTRGRVICVVSASEHEEVQERPWRGRILERTAQVGVLTSDHYHSDRETFLPIAHDVLDGYQKAGTAQLIPSRDEAIRWAIESAQPEDCVLITGQAARYAEDEEIALEVLTDEPRILPFPIAFDPEMN